MNVEPLKPPSVAELFRRYLHGRTEAEAQGLGIPYPPTAERFEMLEETVQICLQMWHGEHGDDQPYRGKHFQLCPRCGYLGHRPLGCQIRDSA